MINSISRSIQLPLAANYTHSINDTLRISVASDAFFAATEFERGFVIGSAVGDLLGATVDLATASAIGEAMLGGPERWWDGMCRRADGSEFLATITLDEIDETENRARQHLISFPAVNAPAPPRQVELNLLNSIYDNAPGFIAIAEGPEHRFTYANPSYLRLVGRDELVGATVVEALPEMVDQGIIAVLDQVYRTGSPFVASELPMRIANNSGEWSELRYLSFVYQAVRNVGGNITGIFCEGFDVTSEMLATNELMLLQAEVAHSSRLNAMGMMAATIAHELNQPLAAITSFAAGSARLLESSGPLADSLGYALRSIEEAALKAGDIVRNVQELTKRGETPRATFELKLAIGECIRLVQAGSFAGVEIRDTTPDELTIFGDRTQVQQVLINLLRNACDATDNSVGGEVTISSKWRAGRLGREIVICVTDAGPGLSSAAIEGLFTWTDSSKCSGMGLGLAISRNMIEAHNGEIWVGHSSDAGTQFCFSLPATDVV